MAGPNQRERITRLPDFEADRRLSAPQTEVVARQVNGSVPQPVNPELDGLIQGLAAFNPALNNLAKVRGENDEEDGSQDRALGKPKKETASERYVRGYMTMDGAVRAQADQQAILEAYQTTFDKETGNLEAFMAEQVNSRLKGMDDPAFRRGYERGLAPLVPALRKQHLEYHRERTVERVESNAISTIDGLVRDSLSRGEPVNQENLEKLKGFLSGTMGVSHSRFNDLLWSAVKRVGDEGNPGIYDIFKRRNADGTPGMYSIPAWREKIDQAQLFAQRTFLANEERVRVAQERLREERQEQAMDRVLDLLMDGKPQDAQTLFDELRRGTITRASDTAKFYRMFQDISKREATPAQQATMMNLMVEIAKGTMGYTDVLRAAMDADITHEQRLQVIREARAARSEARSEARAAQTEARAARAEGLANVNAIFRSPEFDMGERYIRQSLASMPSPTDPMGEGTVFERQQRAAAVLEFSRLARTTNDPRELDRAREEIVKRYLARRTQWNNPGPGARDLRTLPGAGQIRFTTFPEAHRARQNGLLSNAEYDLHIRFFEQTTP
jgi:hypothetical protein